MKTARLAGALLFLVLSAGPASAQSDSWATMAPDPYAERPTAPSVVEIGGKLYVHWFDQDGAGTQSSFVPRLTIYSPSSNTWTVGAPPSIVRFAPSVGVINGKMYVVGGCILSDCGNITNMLEIYDPATNTWSSGAPMVTARLGAAAGVLAGKLYVTGGSLDCGECNTTTSTEIYDPIANSWTAGPAIPTGRQLASGVVVNGRFFVIGGWAAGAFVGTVDVYDVVTRKWSSRAPSPIVRYAAAAGVIGGDIYVVGGLNTTGFLSVNESYNPETDSWTPRAPMPTPRGYTSGAVVEAKLYVIGGSNGNVVNTNEAYTPLAPPFTATVQPPINVNGTSVFNSSRGVVPVKFRLEVGGQGTCELPPATIAVFRTGTGTPVAITETEYTTTSDTGTSFKVTGCQYEYNLGSGSLGTGMYLVQISIGGNIVGSGAFGLK